MHKAQMQITDFHRACGLPTGLGPDEIPLLPEAWQSEDLQMRYGLIAEETEELRTGLANGSATEVVDALCDILYVTYGFAIALGIDLETFFNEVHRTNMMKASGPKREDGKQLKPEGWAPPRIEQMLTEMYNYFYGTGTKVENSTDQSDLQSRVLSVVKDSPSASSFVPGSEVHGLLQEPT